MNSQAQREAVNTEIFKIYKETVREYSKQSDVYAYVPRKVSGNKKFFGFLGKYLIEYLRNTKSYKSEEEFKNIIDQFSSTHDIDLSEDGTIDLDNAVYNISPFSDTALNVLESYKNFNEKDFYKVKVVRVSTKKELLEFVKSFLHDFSTNVLYKTDLLSAIVVKNFETRLTINYPELYEDFSDFVVDIKLYPRKEKVVFNILPTKFVLENTLISNTKIASFQEMNLSLSFLFSDAQNNFIDVLPNYLRVILKSQFGGIGRIYHYGYLTRFEIIRHNKFYRVLNLYDFIDGELLKEQLEELEMIHEYISKGLLNEDLNITDLISSLEKSTMFIHLIRRDDTNFKFTGLLSQFKWLEANILDKKMHSSSIITTSERNDIFNSGNLLHIVDPFATFTSLEGVYYTIISSDRFNGKQLVHEFAVPPASFTTKFKLEVGPDVI